MRGGLLTDVSIRINEAHIEVNVSKYISRCRTSRNFPEECFCWDRVCAHPYLPLHKIFMKLKSQGEEFKQIFPGIDKSVSDRLLKNR